MWKPEFNFACPSQPSGVREMAWLVKSLHGNLNLISRIRVKIHVWQFIPVDPSAGELETGRFLGSLASQPSLVGELQA